MVLEERTKAEKLKKRKAQHVKAKRKGREGVTCHTQWSSNKHKRSIQRTNMRLKEIGCGAQSSFYEARRRETTLCIGNRASDRDWRNISITWVFKRMTYDGGDGIFHLTNLHSLIVKLCIILAVSRCFVHDCVLCRTLSIVLPVRLKVMKTISIPTMQAQSPGHFNL